MGERGPVAERWSECVRSALTSVLAARLASGPKLVGCAARAAVQRAGGGYQRGERASAGRGAARLSR